MKKGSWKRKIKEAAIAAGTYQPYFDLFIDQLAGILEIRDDAQKAFKESGGQPVVSKLDSYGNIKLSKNPAIMVISDCNQQALNYWKEMGLTAAGFKKITSVAPEESKKEVSFEELLSKIGV